MRPSPIEELSVEQRREIAAWIDAHNTELPESVRIFLSLHQRYLTAEGDLRKEVNAVFRELRRALHFTPSTEKRRSGSPLSDLPPAESARSKEKIEGQIDRGNQLADWHQGLNERHHKRVYRLEEKLKKMNHEKKANDEVGEKVPRHEPERLEDIELTDEEIADNKSAAKRFTEHLLLGDGADQALTSTQETLMPGGSVIESEEHVRLPAEIPEELSEARVVKTLTDHRTRYDFSVAVTRIDLDVEKKVVVDRNGDRYVIASSTADYGPPRYSVTWDALVTLAILVGQFALPFNRLSTLLSTKAKRFTTSALSRMVHYVAERLLPIYLELANQLANAEVLAGDDTSCRVLEVSDYFAKSALPNEKPKKPPWADYRTPTAAEESCQRCEQTRKERMERRDAGDRSATRLPEETPSIGIRIGRRLVFESQRRNGDGPKEGMHATVMSGRAIAEDPQSRIVFYRSHLGSCGNLFEDILKSRDPDLREVILQGDLSSTNLVTSPELLEQFDTRQIGCFAHARRPFAIYEDEDPERCGYMLHLFLGLAIHEDQLDVFGRNQDNVRAVRDCESREMWNQILELAKKMTNVWSKATALGTAARYIIKHFEALTAYLDDPRLEMTNNLSERMLRMEKLIEGSSMFRKSLEGRFVLDVVRTILQTAVAAGVPVHEYLVSVLRANEDDIVKNPGRFAPRAWAEANLDNWGKDTSSPS